jgi:hypothetical protein
MALSSKSKNTNGKLLILKIKTKDEDDKAIPPCFQVSEKGSDGKYAKRSETVTNVSGNLVKVEVREGEWKGDKYNTISIYLVDGDEIYLIDTRPNMLSRSMYNSLLSLNTFDNISISLYTYKKTDEKRGTVTEYPAVAVRQNDEIVKWTIPISDQPKPKAVLFKGKTQNDYSDVENLFIEKMRDLGKVVEASTKSSGKAPKAKENATVNAHVEAEANAQTEQEDDKNVPF